MFSSLTTRTADQTIAAVRLTNVHRLLEQALTTTADPEERKALLAALAASFRLAGESATSGLRMAQVTRFVEEHPVVAALRENAHEKKPRAHPQELFHPA